MAAEVKSKLQIEDLLKNKKVKVVPIIREGGMHPKGHDGEFMYTDTYCSFDLRPEPGTNRYRRILTEEEREVFEDVLNLEKGSMSFYKKNGFWATFRPKLDKNIKVLDLSDTLQYLEYLVIKEHRQVAPSWEARYSNGEFKWALVDEEEDVKTNNTKAELNKKAYRHFIKIEDSVDEMTMVIRLVTNKTVQSNNIEFLRAEIQKLIDTKINEFVEVMEDKSFSTKSFIYKALDVRAIERNTKGGFTLKGGDEFARTLSEAVTFLESNKNQDIYLRIQAQIENANGNTKKGK